MAKTFQKHFLIKIIERNLFILFYFILFIFHLFNVGNKYIKDIQLKAYRRNSFSIQRKC